VSIAINKVVVNRPQPPVAKLTADPTTINETGTSALDGTASFDPDGTITSYKFEQTAGTPGTITVDSTNPAKATFTAPSVNANETATIALTVTDNDGATNTATTDIIINKVIENKPPVADAGRSQTVNEGDTVTLDGSDSFDPDGDTLTFKWTQTAGTDATLSDDTAVKPTFTAPNIESTQATLTFELTVDDGHGHTTTDDVNVKVNSTTQVIK
jgi:hypothetical protein